ncbi:hypothetical protein GLYMA_12G187100v4 [Glycine max]|nr:uncharacterized protein LOC114379469 [Glycine soja]KAG4385939.1 hypothetical protein GLYMA_12G187100v4 [Glycine max]KAH1143865.1 hypothetical protein GYH30_034201 [Glycine max]
MKFTGDGSETWFLYLVRSKLGTRKSYFGWKRSNKKMCKRKGPSSELRQPNMPTSPPEVVESSSGELPEEFSWSSCLSSSVSSSSKIPIEDEENVQRANASPETKAMDLVGCPRCFMYVMLSEVDPKCPKCKTTVFLELFKDENFNPDN